MVVEMGERAKEQDAHVRSLLAGRWVDAARVEQTSPRGAAGEDSHDATVPPNPMRFASCTLRITCSSAAFADSSSANDSTT